MPKPSLEHPHDQLERDLIETLRAGLKQWRPDLNNPESFSDWQACVRGLLQMYEVKRRPIAIDISTLYSSAKKEA